MTCRLFDSERARDRGHGHGGAQDRASGPHARLPILCAAQKAARQRAGVIAGVDDDLAVDEDGRDADGIAMRIVVRCAISDPPRIEDGDVGPAALAQHAAVGETQRGGGGARRLVDGGRQRQQLQVAYERPEKSRVSPVRARMRLDRKSTRLNSSHEWISYAVFCLKKKSENYYVNQMM